MVKVIGCTDHRAVPQGATDGLMGSGVPLAPLGSGSQGTIVSTVRERTRGDLVATTWVEQWWPDEATFDEWWRGAREPSIPSDSGTWWLTREHVLRRPEVGRGQLKMLGTAYRRADFSSDDFFRYWREVHGPISAAVPGLGGYVVTEVLRRLWGPMEADGFVEQWWPDAPTLDAANHSPQVAIAWADVANYAETTGTFWLVDEVVLDTPTFSPGILEEVG